MVLLVGKTDLRLISPDRKQVLLYKDLKDVASCTQGNKNSDHFGIILRENRSDGPGGYIGYVFKCQSDSVADDILAAITQAFIACSESKRNRKSQVFSCEHCPMLWYHKLCTDIEGLSDKKMQTMIFRRIDQLSEEEQDSIMAKYYGAEEMADHSLAEQNQFLMMLLRAHSEVKWIRVTWLHLLKFLGLIDAFVFFLCSVSPTAARPRHRREPIGILESIFGRQHHFHEG